MLSAPISIAPAPSSRSISVASRDAGASSRLIFDPARVARPLTSNRFFTAKGTPASGPASLPEATRASTAFALARARSAVTSVNAFRTGLCLLIRASAVSVTESADILRLATACAIAAADSPSALAVIAISGAIDTGRLGFIWELELIHQRRQPRRHFEVGTHRRPPAFLDRQRQGLADGIDVVLKRIGSHASSLRLFLVNRQRRVRNRRQQFLGIRILRVAEHAFGKTLLDDSSGPHHDDTIAQQTHYVQIVRHEQIAHAHRRLEVLQQVEHDRLHRDVEGCGRLVEDDELWMQRNRARDADAGLLATGQLV